MKIYSITKYTPSLRSENGIYIGNEWIGFDDIGKTFNGVTLSFSEYIEIEFRYIRFVLLLMDYLEVRSLKIDHLYKFSDKSFMLSSKRKDAYLADKINDFFVNQKLNSREAIATLMRLRLREFVGELEITFTYKKKTQIFFGFDYYMYVKSNIESTIIQKAALEVGLYVN